MRFLRAFDGTALLQARHYHQEGPGRPRGDDRYADGVPGHILQRYGGVAGAVLGLPRAAPLLAEGLLYGRASVPPDRQPLLISQVRRNPLNQKLLKAAKIGFNWLKIT